MKFQNLFKERYSHYFLKTYRRMKIGLLLLLVGILHLKSENIYPQVVSLSLSIEKATIEQALDQIEKNSEYKFLIIDNSLETNKIVRVKCK